MTIGQVAPEAPGATFTTTNAVVQTQTSTTGSVSYTVPFPGVITSWSSRNTQPAGIARLKVFHYTSGASFSVVGQSAPEGFAIGEAPSFSTRIPVAEGDRLGIFTPSASSGPVAAYGPASPPVNKIGRFDPVDPDPQPGSTADIIGETSDRWVNVAAVIEPDADGDGFGDETQDECPTDASTQAECIAPETQITKGPKAKTKKKTATFEFTSSEPNSGFECSLDGGAFEPCVSPQDVKVKKGKHTFSVRAGDAAGNVDPTPASDAWKVKKRRKK